MADWTVPVPYNYNTPYHAYAYSLMYQTVHQNLPEQNHPQNLSGWSEAAAYNPEAYYPSRDESPPESPEQIAGNNNHHGHFQGSGVVYFGDTQAGRLFHYPDRSQYDARRAGEAERAGSSGTPTSDSEAHTSPDSWSSSSSREGSLPQSDPITWAGTNLDDEGHDGSKHVSSSLLDEEPQQPSVLCIVDGNSSAPSSPKPVSSSTQKKSVAPKAKTRTAFSESQMKTLTQRFSVQRYLTQAEMKNLAGFTGLSYKQVKTWFQNRRMKLRRHQKDTSWVSERYTVNKNESAPNSAVYASVPSHIQAYQGEAQAHLQEQYSQQMREAAALKNPTPAQNLSYYLASVGAATVGTGYPPLASPSPSQPAGWPVQPPNVHYKYNPNTFSKAGAAGANDSDTSFDGDEGNPARIPSPLGMSMGHTAGR